jgi:hypothetical protein
MKRPFPMKGMVPERPTIIEHLLVLLEFKTEARS